MCVCVCAQPSQTLCNSIGCTPPGSPIHGISEAKILEQIAISFSRGSSPPRIRSSSCIFCIGRRILYHYVTWEALNDYVKWKWRSLTCVWLFVTPWTIRSMEFSRAEYWSGYSFSSPGDLPNPRTEPRSPTLQAGSLPAEPQGKPNDSVINPQIYVKYSLHTVGSGCPQKLLSYPRRKLNYRAVSSKVCPLFQVMGFKQQIQIGTRTQNLTLQSLEFSGENRHTQNRYVNMLSGKPKVNILHINGDQC